MDLFDLERGSAGANDHTKYVSVSIKKQHLVLYLNHNNYLYSSFLQGSISDNRPVTRNFDGPVKNLLLCKNLNLNDRNDAINYIFHMHTM